MAATAPVTPMPFWLSITSSEGDVVSSSLETTTTLCQSMVLQLLILRIWQLDPVRFGQESARLRSYTKAKLLDSSPETPASSP